MLTLHITEEMENRLAPIAKAAGKTTQDYVSEAVAEYLQDLEDIHIANQRLADIRSGKTKPISSAELRKELGLDD